MKLEHYNIVTTSDTSFEGAKLKMREKVMDMCKQGWKLQGGASVAAEFLEGKCDGPDYFIYQTVIK